MVQIADEEDPQSQIPLRLAYWNGWGSLANRASASLVQIRAAQSTGAGVVSL